ncbi:MAG TPA: sensor histidine kinase, partial [Chitinophagaceae bacterium]|nr:sensor histidine kinase [Chitinophagaceae bacterium]
NQTDAYQAFVLQIPKSGYATVYVQTNDSSYKLQTGSLLPLTERSIQANTNAFRLFIKSNEKATVWLKLQSVYSIYTPRNYDLSIKTEAEFMRQDNKRLLWQGIFLGVILIMSLYNFFIGVAVKDVSYLYYVLSIVGIGTYFAFYYGFGIEYLWPKRPLWDTFCYLIIVPFSGLMRLLFTRTYLHTPQLLPNTNFLMNILMGLNIFVMSFGLIAYLFKIDIILILIEIIGFTGTAIHLLMLIAGIIAYSEKYRPAKYFIWANLVLVVGAILFIGRELGLLQDNFMTRYLVQIGFLIQVVVFSLGLASRLNAMRGQLAKEMLEKERVALEREREKKELIEQQRKELLVQVEQQTKDLKNKNVELEKSFALVKESENKQTELNELKNKLFSIISHDLRNPLATMQSFLKLITEHHHKLNEDEKQKLFTQAQQSLDNLNLLMYNLLQWSRSQMNLLEFKSEKISVRPILENAATVLQLNAHMKNIAVKVQSEENLCVYADKEMTEFVVRNLISNAIKFSHRNNTIAVKAYQQDNSIVIEVQDSGIGLTENKIKKLLEMNTTVSSRGTEKEKGTGLGLLISKEFIKKNNGRLYIISEPGKGSSFSFTLQKAG